MKNYTATYLEFFGYDISSFVPCEVCNARSTEIHHVWARSIKKHLENDITNLMALCRSCHSTLGDRKQHREYLQNIHNEKMKQHAQQT